MNSQRRAKHTRPGGGDCVTKKERQAGDRGGVEPKKVWLQISECSNALLRLGAYLARTGVLIITNLSCLSRCDDWMSSAVARPVGSEWPTGR